MQRTEVGRRLALADPAGARVVDKAWDEHCVHDTRRKYTSIGSSYVHFCELRDVDPWPACDIRVAAWMLRICTTVKWTSMGSYLAGLRDQQLSLGMAWELKGSERIRRSMRWIKRKFPCNPVGVKFAVSLAVLRSILPRLKEWPKLEAMSHDDRLFATASMAGTAGMLRAGEFTTSPRSSRGVLPMENVRVRVVGGAPALVLSIPQPKARWWLQDVDVPCIGCGDEGSPFYPVRLWRALVEGSPAVARAGKAGSGTGKLPAFHFADGSPLTRDWLVRRTSELAIAAGVSMVDNAGRPLPVKSASWRAGGVRSATDASLSDPMVMFLGRWKSGAFKNYMCHTPVDVRRAARKMWAAKSSVQRSGEDSKAFLVVRDPSGASDRSIRAIASSKAHDAVDSFPREYWRGIKRVPH